MPSEVRSCGLASVRVFVVGLEQPVVERRQIRQQHVGLRQVAERRSVRFSVEPAPLIERREPLRPGAAGRAGRGDLQAVLLQLRAIHFEQLDVDDHFRPRLVDGREHAPPRRCARACP